MAFAMRTSIAGLNLVIVAMIGNSWKLRSRRRGRVFGVLLCFGVLLRPTNRFAFGGGGMANGTP
jgi:hypothetical protein